MNKLKNMWGRYRLWIAKDGAQYYAEMISSSADELNEILRKHDLGIVSGGAKTFGAVSGSLRFGAVKRAEKRLTEELVTDVLAYTNELERRLNKSPYIGLNVRGDYHA